MLLLHIVIALLSIVVTSLMYLKPATRTLQASYALVVLTLVSGTVLVFMDGVNMLRACMSGLVYLALVSVGIALGRKKLAEQEA